jgi:DNA (cytosine-5)-methyltransferase 1
VARIIKEKRPKAFLLENVKNLVSHDRRKTFQIILETLRELEYHVHYRVLDGKHYVPQHRERIVIVGFDKHLFNGPENFHFPALPPVSSCVADILDEDEAFTQNFTLSDKLWKYLRDYAEKHRLKGNGFGYGLADPGCTTRTLSARYHKDGSEILIPQHGANPRKLTPRECARLQGFPDEFRIVVSNTQAYKQFGNSVVVPLMQAVGEEILRTLGIGDEKPGFPKVASGSIVGQAEIFQ